MFQAIRRHFNATGFVAVLALVFAMSGGAYAASRYVITSTKQIKPSVLKSLQGRAGKAGATGATGPAGSVGPQGAVGVKGETGAMGPQGPEGPAGKEGREGKEGKPAGFPETLPNGKTERGVWSLFFTATEAAQLMSSAISFSIPLAEVAEARHETNIIGPEEGEGEKKENTMAIPSHCKGTVEKPEAAPGNFCLFIRSSSNAGPGFYAEDVFDTETGTAGTTGVLGAMVAGSSLAAGPVLMDGTWAVTAPEAG
jgi:hypothetical protein